MQQRRHTGFRSPTRPVIFCLTDQSGLPMPRRSPKEARDRILAGARRIVCRSGPRALTVDEVAQEAKCAKGLVLYHFKSRRGLLEAVLSSLVAERETTWTQAFQEPLAEGVVDRTWALLTDESKKGIHLALAQLRARAADVSDQLVRKSTLEFNRFLGRQLDGLFRRQGAELRLPADEMGQLFGAIVIGIESQLLAGVHLEDAQGAYTAGWLAVMELVRA